MGCGLSSDASLPSLRNCMGKLCFEVSMFSPVSPLRKPRFWGNIPYAKKPAGTNGHHSGITAGFVLPWQDDRPIDWIGKLGIAFLHGAKGELSGVSTALIVGLAANNYHSSLHRPRVIDSSTAYGINQLPHAAASLARRQTVAVAYR